MASSFHINISLILFQLLYWVSMLTIPTFLINATCTRPLIIKEWMVLTSDLLSMEFSEGNGCDFYTKEIIGFEQKVINYKRIN